MEKSVCDIIGFVRRIQNNMKDYLSKAGLLGGVSNLTVAQLDILAYLYEKKSATMGELAKNAGVKMPSMTDTVDKLVKSGLVKRQRSEKDRRTVTVFMSKPVEKIVQKHLKKRDSALAGILECMTGAEKKQTVILLNKIIKSMEKGGIK